MGEQITPDELLEKNVSKSLWQAGQFTGELPDRAGITST